MVGDKMQDQNMWSGWMPPMNPQYNPYQRQLPRYEIVKVKGEAGARAFQMAPNSSILLADETNPNLIWLVQTDGAGYLTPTPLDVSVHKQEEQSSILSLEERIKQLEDKYELLNSGLGKQSKKKRQQSAEVLEEQSTDSAS